MANPLLDEFELPPFSSFNAADIEPAVDHLLAANKKRLNELLASGGPYTWANLVHPMELMDDQLSRMWAPVSHLNSMMNNDA